MMKGIKLARYSRNRENIFPALFSLVLGVLLAWITFDMVGIPAAYGILKNTGLWVAVASLIAYFGRTAVGGAISAVALGLGRFLALVTRPFIMEQSMPGMPLYHLVFCVMLGLIGFLAYSAHENRWVGALCGAVPVAFLLSEGYPALYSRSTALIFDIVMAVFLFFIILRGSERRLRSIPFIIAFSFLLIHFNVLAQMTGVYL